MPNRRTRSAATFAQGIRGSAAMPCCLTNPACTVQAGLDRGDVPQAAGCEACINGGCLSASCVFEMRCVAWRSKICTDGGRAGATTAALVRNGPSSSAAEAVSRCRPRDELCRGKTATQGLQHETCNTRPCRARNRWGEGAIHARVEAGLNVPRQSTARRMVCHLRYEFTGVMVSGCGTGLIHCRGQTGRRFATEMR